MIEAGLVAGDAGVDLLGPAGAGLGHELRSASSGRAIDTRSALSVASRDSATSGVLIRLLAITGTFSSWRSRALTSAKARAAPR